jgi:branched-chain amino acid transport system ATP-binding protein
MLELHDVSVARGRVPVLHGISLSVQRGELVALIGANGAGKTTLLHAISGLLPVTSGTILWRDGAREVRIDGMAAERIVGLGLIHCPEGRQVFASLTVRENLLLGAYLRRDRDGIRRDLDWCTSVFPVLGERLHQRAGSLSGGEQTMLAIARALMGRPRLLMLDEPSLGLAPQVVDRVFDTLMDLHRSGLPMLLVEQNAEAALEIATRACVLANGRIVRSGPAAVLREDPEVRAAYLGPGT